MLLLTPTPANAATATEQAAYATAVALTTGTFTPVPTGFVTPIIVPPSPPAQNVATAAAQVLAATATAQAPTPDGLLPTTTPTPLPFNAVLGRVRLCHASLCSDERGNGRCLQQAAQRCHIGDRHAYAAAVERHYYHSRADTCTADTYADSAVHSGERSHGYTDAYADGHTAE